MNEIIDRAMEHPAVKGFDASIKNKIPVEYLPCAEGSSYWSSEIRDGAAYIYYAPSPYPAACTMHELLHVDLQVNHGYIRIRGGASHFDLTQNFAPTLTALDNELQHHKFYARFACAGFKPHEFYSHAEPNAYKHINGFLAGKVDIQTALRQYLSLVAPGGNMTDRQKEKLHIKFRRKNGGSYARVYDIIDVALRDWISQGNCDHRDVMKKIFLSLPGGDLTFISYSGQPDGDGYFVGEEFDLG